jgi:type I restriction enzyme S subunit
MTDVNKLITDNIDVWTSAIKKRNSQGRGSNKKIELVGVKKLRELILELAVRGKLVPQDANDEPASVLLERIVEEKAQLIAEKKIKKQKPLPAITDEEKPFELPSGWSLTRLDDICFGITSGSTPPKDKFDENKGVPYLKVYNIKDQKVAFDYRPQFVDSQHHKEKLTRSILYPNDVVMNIVGPPLGKIAIIPDDYPEWNCNQAIVFFRPIEPSLSCYIYTYLKSGQFLDAIELIGTAGQDNISVTKSRSIIFQMPPVDEQHRIVAKVDELMALCDQLEQQTEQSIGAHQTLVEVLLAALTNCDSTDDFQTSWQRIAEHFDVLFTTEQSIEQLKQTILQLAVMGKLVPQNPSDEPASVLLEKIAEEKAQLIADKRIKKQKPLPAITDEEKPFVLPNGWEWERLGTTCRKVTDGAHNPPPNAGKGYPMLSCKEVNFGKIDFSLASRFVDQDGFDKEDKRTAISPGDILLNIVASIGRSAVVPENTPKFVLQRNVAVLDSMLEAHFFTRHLASPLCYSYYAEHAKGTAQQVIYLGKLSLMPLAIPPLAEQHRIVAKVDELMALCDQLKARLSDAQTTQLHLADAVVENALSAPASS